MWSVHSGIPWCDYRKGAKDNELWDEWAFHLNRVGRNWLVPSVNMGIERFFDKNLYENKKPNLDLCCGFHPHVSGSVGLDVSFKALEELGRWCETFKRDYKGMVQFNLNDLANNYLPFRDSSFSSSTMVCGWNYVKPIDRVIEEVDRVVVSGGPFYVVQFGCSVEESMAVRKDGILDIESKFRSLGYSPESIDVYKDKVWAIRISVK